MERPKWLYMETCEGAPSGRGIFAYGLGYGNDIIRAYSPGGRAHDIAGTQGEMIQCTDWRRSDHCGIRNDL